MFVTADHRLAYLLQIFVHRDHPSHSWPMLGGMWGARLDLTRKSNKEEGEGESPASGEARSLLARLVSDMLHSPISWASVYLADQAYHHCDCCMFVLENFLFMKTTTQVQLQRVFWPAVQGIALVNKIFPHLKEELLPELQFKCVPMYFPVHLQLTME